MLEKFEFYIIPSLITFIGTIYIQCRILNKNVSCKNFRFYIGMLIFLVLNILSYMLVTGFIKLIVNTIIISLICSIIYKEKINKILIAVILTQVLYFFSELVIIFILLMLSINIDTILLNQISFILYNMGVVIIGVLLYFIPIIKKIINKSISISDDFTGIKKYVIIFIFFITLNVFMMFMYFSADHKHIILINAIFILIYSMIIYSLIKEKSENVKFKQENRMLLDNLNDYEKMLDYQRVNNHENKNQLLVIRGMINVNNKKALAYLDEVINEKRKDDEGLYTFTKIIPEGGLQGLVYQKVLKMKENNIKIDLDIDKKIRKVNFDCMSSKVIYDLCKAVGVILDNAIEEVINLEEREILISMYTDERYLFIEVSNKCSVIPDLSKLDEKGYTTKSEGHGYGLCVLKDIVTNNKCIINIRSISKDIFTQTIKIKCKN